MTVGTDFTSAANRALRLSEKGRKSKNGSEDETTTTDINGNPVEHETRFGVLPPWGGAWGGGASTPYDHEPQTVMEDDE